MRHRDELVGASRYVRQHQSARGYFDLFEWLVLLGTKPRDLELGSREPHNERMGP